MTKRHRTKFIHEGQYAVAVEIDWVGSDTGWSPYLSVQDAQKLDQVREALRTGDLKKAGRLAHDPAENLRRLEISQLASCHLQLQPNEVFRTLKGQCYEGSYIVSRDCLIRLVGADRIRQLAFQNAHFNFKNVVGFHERSGPKDRARQVEFANVFFDLPFALPMRDASVPLRPAYGAVDKVLYAGFPRNLGQVFTLFDLALRPNRPEILDAGRPCVAEAVGKWKSRVVGGISMRGGKLSFWSFPRRVFSTAF